MDIVFNGLLGNFGRRTKERADIDVETEIREGAGDDFLAAIVAVLSHFGDYDSRAAAFGFFELLNQLPYFFHMAIPADLGGIDAADCLDGGFVAAENFFQGG